MNETKQPGTRLAHYKAGENVAALWQFDDIIIYANFRCHGHGELDILARRAGDAEWVELAEGMNADFGRTIDRQMQKIMQRPTTPIMIDLAAKLGKAIQNEEDALDFLNELQDRLLTSEDMEMDGPDFLKIFPIDSDDDGENVESQCLLAEFCGEFTRDALAYNSSKPVKELISTSLQFLSVEDLEMLQQEARRAIENQKKQQAELQETFKKQGWNPITGKEC